MLDRDGRAEAAEMLRRLASIVPAHGGVTATDAVHVRSLADALEAEHLVVEGAVDLPDGPMLFASATQAMKYAALKDASCVINIHVLSHEEGARLLADEAADAEAGR